MAYFQVTNLQKSYDSIEVNVSFECEKNTMTCILGPSGSGKSTILRLTAGLEHPESGSIILNNKDITSLKINKRGIGMVFQSPSLFNHMTVEENVAYGLVCHGESRKSAKQKASELLKNFGLQSFEKRSPETLSGGEAQRVSLARTLIVKPELVLFDEPLSALDAPLRKKLAAEIRLLQQNLGFTGIMVTHDLQEAKAVADRIILIKKGKIMWQGPASSFNEEMLEN